MKDLTRKKKEKQYEIRLDEKNGETREEKKWNYTWWEIEEKHYKLDLMEEISETRTCREKRKSNEKTGLMQKRRKDNEKPGLMRKMEDN